MNALQIAGLILAILVLAAMAVALFLAAQAGGHGAISRWLDEPFRLTEADTRSRRSGR